ncbi:MAG: amidohydrolase [Myxococcales bacterium]|nr:amidohydrolase [Myxococcales bacterium]
MRNGLKILDADRHVVEPVALWTDYLEDAHRAHAPRGFPFYVATGSGEPPASWDASDLYPMLVVGGKPVYSRMSRAAWSRIVRDATRRPFLGPLDRPETHVMHMDAEGIDAALLYPTYALLIEGVDSLEPEVAAALVRAYNRWLADFVARAHGRLLGAGLISVHHPPSMVEEVDRAERAGFPAVVLRPNPAGGRRLSDAAYAAFWARCEALSLAVVIHEGTHAYLPTAGAERFSSRFAQHACSHPMEQMIALLDLVEGGVFERHPRLRVGFLEAGCGWVPYWLCRLDGEHARLASEVAETVRKPPSACFREQAWVSAEPDEPYLPEILPFVGADRILFGTDFPHVDHDERLTDRAMALAGRVSEGALRGYLWDNGARLFGLGER